MFKQRLLTALILIPLVLGLIYWANPWALSVAVLGLFIALSWEWLELIVIHKLIYKIITMMILLPLLLVTMRHWDLFLMLDIGMWLLIIVAILTYPTSEKIWGNPVVVAIVSAVVLLTFLSVLYVFALQRGAASYLVYLLALVWAVDIVAYLVGKKYGSTKLIPKVSPGKSVEGAIGAIIGGMLIAGCGYWYFQPELIAPWFYHAFLVIVFAMFGDLFISMLKRRCHVKDTGHLLPGHGGILDRLDSLIAALPIFYFLQGM